MHPLAKVALGAAAAALAQDAFIKPGRIARLARSYADRSGKPLLTFVRPRGQSVKSVFTESLALGDANLHPQARPGPVGRGRITQGNPWRVPVRDKGFGAVFSYDVLEHIERPDLALMEWHRIADKVFVVVPAWWSPEAWFSKWVFDGDLRRAFPLWTKTNRIVLLPGTAPRAYAASTCPTPVRRAAPAMRPSRPIQKTSAPKQASASAPPSVPAYAAPQLPSEASPIQMPSPMEMTTSSEPQLLEISEMPTRQELDLDQSDGDQPYLPPSVGTPSSWSGVSDLMIVSGSDDESY